MKNRLLGGYDLILLVYPDSLQSMQGMLSRQEQLESLFTKAGLLK